MVGAFSILPATYTYTTLREPTAKKPDDRSITSSLLGPRHRADARPKTIRVATAVAVGFDACRPHFERTGWASGEFPRSQFSIRFVSVDVGEGGHWDDAARIQTKVGHPKKLPVNSILREKEGRGATAKTIRPQARSIPKKPMMRMSGSMPCFPREETGFVVHPKPAIHREGK